MIFKNMYTPPSTHTTLLPSFQPLQGLYSGLSVFILELVEGWRIWTHPSVTYTSYPTLSLGFPICNVLKPYSQSMAESYLCAAIGTKLVCCISTELACHQLQEVFPGCPTERVHELVRSPVKAHQGWMHCIPSGEGEGRRAYSVHTHMVPKLRLDLAARHLWNSILRTTQTH